MHEEDIKQIWKDTPAQGDPTGLRFAVAFAKNIAAKDTKLIEDLLYLVKRFRYCDESEDYYMEIEEAVEKARKWLEEV